MKCWHCGRRSGSSNKRHDGKKGAELRPVWPVDEAGERCPGKLRYLCRECYREARPEKIIERKGKLEPEPSPPETSDGIELSG